MSNLENSMFYTIIVLMLFSIFCGIMDKYEKQKRIKNVAIAIEQVCGNKRS